MSEPRFRGKRKNISQHTPEAKCQRKYQCRRGNRKSLIEFPLAFCFRGMLGDVFPFVYAIVMILTAVCFITNFKVKKFGLKGNMFLLGIGVLIFAVLLALKFNDI